MASKIKRVNQTELEQNYEVFKKHLPDLLSTDSGRWVLLHESKIVNVFDTQRDAITVERMRYGDNFFSVQQVTAQPINLGWFSHALS